MKRALFGKLLVFLIILIFLSLMIIPSKGDNTTLVKNHYKNLTIEIFVITTKDYATITLTRYNGSKRPSIILIPGYACDHKIFDWDENHTLARFLNKEGWDVWMLDLRTHDGDGDFWFKKDSDHEKINRYWDFDNTYLKIDVVTAIDFIKNNSKCEKIIILGHSMGGYLCYAYTELIDQENVTAIITMGASGIGYSYGIPLVKYYIYGFRIGKRAYVNPFGLPYRHVTRYLINKIKTFNPYYFYKNTTSIDIQENYSYTLDDEPAGVYVDILLGKEIRFNKGRWVDPQTLYDYTSNLKKIQVPCLAVAGDEDLVDPAGDMFATYIKIGSEGKKFLHYPNYAHMDLLLGDNASLDIFPEITCWLSSFEID